MKKIFIFILLAGIITSGCGSKKTESGADDTQNPSELPGQNLEQTKISPEIIVNESTADNPAQDDNTPRPVITYTKDFHDFGVINDGDLVEYSFAFKNTGKADLVISNASASCGCTVPDYPKEPIAPGQGGKIKVKFNSQDRSGINEKTITITANTNPSQTYLKIRAEVKEPK